MPRPGGKSFSVRHAKHPSKQTPLSHFTSIPTCCHVLCRHRQCIRPSVDHLKCALCRGALCAAVCRRHCLCAAALMKSVGSGWRPGLQENPSPTWMCPGPVPHQGPRPLHASNNSSRSCSWTQSSCRRWYWQVRMSPRLRSTQQLYDSGCADAGLHVGIKPALLRIASFTGDARRAESWSIVCAGSAGIV